MESNEKNNALINRNNRLALFCSAAPAPDTRCGAGRAGGSPPVGGIDITCISPNGFVLPLCGLRFWSGLAARSAYIDVIRRFVLASFVPFCRSAALQPSPLLDQSCPAWPLPKSSIEITGVSRFVLLRVTWRACSRLGRGEGCRNLSLNSLTFPHMALFCSFAFCGRLLAKPALTRTNSPAGTSAAVVVPDRLMRSVKLRTGLQPPSLSRVSIAPAGKIRKQILVYPHYSCRCGIKQRYLAEAR